MFDLVNYLITFQIGLQHIFDAVKLKNNAAFERLLKKAIEVSLGSCIFSECTLLLCFIGFLDQFRHSSANNNRIPRMTNVLHDVMKSAAAEARKVS